MNVATGLPEYIQRMALDGNQCTTQKTACTIKNCLHHRTKCQYETCQHPNLYEVGTGDWITHGRFKMSVRAAWRIPGLSVFNAGGSREARSKRRPGFLYLCTLEALTHLPLCCISAKVLKLWIASKHGPECLMVWGVKAPAVSLNLVENRLKRSSYFDSDKEKTETFWLRQLRATCRSRSPHQGRWRLSAKTMSSVAPAFVRLSLSAFPMMTPHTLLRDLTGRTRSSPFISRISDGRAYKSYWRSAATAASISHSLIQNRAKWKTTCGGTPTRVVPGLAARHADKAARDKGSNSLSGWRGTVLRAIHPKRV